MGGNASCRTIAAGDIPRRPHHHLCNGRKAKESNVKRQRNKDAYEDLVCGMEISRKTALDEFSYHGKTYYFCAGTCREAFEAEPEKYLRQHRQHGVRPK